MIAIEAQSLAAGTEEVYVNDDRVDGNRLVIRVLDPSEFQCEFRGKGGKTVRLIIITNAAGANAKHDSWTILHSTRPRRFAAHWLIPHTHVCMHPIMHIYIPMYTPAPKY